MLDLQAAISGPRFLDLTFGDSFKTARRDDGAEIRFTRHESALLEILTARPGRLLTRDQLLTAMSGDDAARSDRTVDFTVNRLRRKLGCPARAPRFIRALYGEGYIWIAPQHGGGADDFLILYPSVATDRRKAEALGALTQTLMARVPAGMTMRCCASAREAVAFPATPFGVEVSFHDADGALHAAVVLTDRRLNRVIAAQRMTFHTAGEAANAEARRVAETVHAAIWRQMVLSDGEIASAASPPLELRADAAAELLMRVNAGQGDDADFSPEALGGGASDTLVRAMRMQSDLLRQLRKGVRDPGLLDQHCAQLERMVLEALPELQNEPLLMLAAAKLLVDANRSHADLAERLARSAFERTTAFAAAFATLGQICAAKGAYRDAIDLFDRGLALCAAGSEFMIYLLAWKCYAALALRDKAVFVPARAALFGAKPQARAHIGLILFGLDAESEDAEVAGMIAGAEPARLRRQIESAYALFERRMCDHDALRSMLERTVLAAIAAHGEQVVPAHVREAIAGRA